MGPVSFQRLCEGQSRSELLGNARLLTAAGVRVQSIDDQLGLLIRSDDVVRARQILERS